VQRFFVAPTLPLRPGADFALPPDVAHQAGHVLRLRPGARILLLDNSGDECEVELMTFTRGEIIARVVERRAGAPAPGPRVTLYQCALKGEKFVWVLQKATELGVAGITPVASARTIAGEGDLSGGKAERWSRIVREAAEQCRAARLPTLGRPLPWAAAVAEGRRAPVAIVPWEDAPAGDLGAVLAAARQAASVSLYIGPEGGLTAEEVALARAAGAIVVSLGPRVLRAETAAVATLAALLLPL
jgi:16S rRNA (uracil1498-N3)-methyltransferase